MILKVLLISWGVLSIIQDEANSANVPSKMAKRTLGFDEKDIGETESTETLTNVTTQEKQYEAQVGPDGDTSKLDWKEGPTKTSSKVSMDRTHGRKGLGGGEVKIAPDNSNSEGVKPLGIAPSDDKSNDDNVPKSYFETGGVLTTPDGQLLNPISKKPIGSDLDDDEEAAIQGGPNPGSAFKIIRTSTTYVVVSRKEAIGDVKVNPDGQILDYDTELPTGESLEDDEKAALQGKDIPCACPFRLGFKIIRIISKTVALVRRKVPFCGVPVDNQGNLLEPFVDPPGSPPTKPTGETLDYDENQAMNGNPGDGLADKLGFKVLGRKPAYNIVRRKMSPAYGDIVDSAGKVLNPRTSMPTGEELQQDEKEALKKMNNNDGTTPAEKMGFKIIKIITINYIVVQRKGTPVNEKGNCLDPATALPNGEDIEDDEKAALHSKPGGENAIKHGFKIVKVVTPTYILVHRKGIPVTDKGKIIDPTTGALTGEELEPDEKEALSQGPDARACKLGFKVIKVIKPDYILVKRKLYGDPVDNNAQLLDPATGVGTGFYMEPDEKLALHNQPGGEPAKDMGFKIIKVVTPVYILVQRKGVPVTSAAEVVDPKAMARTGEMLEEDEKAAMNDQESQATQNGFKVLKKINPPLNNLISFLVRRKFYGVPVDSKGELLDPPTAAPLGFFLEPDEKLALYGQGSGEAEKMGFKVLRVVRRDYILVRRKGVPVNNLGRILNPKTFVPIEPPLELDPDEKLALNKQGNGAPEKLGFKIIWIFNPVSLILVTRKCIAGIPVNPQGNLLNHFAQPTGEDIEPDEKLALHGQGDGTPEALGFKVLRVVNSTYILIQRKTRSHPNPPVNPILPVIDPIIPVIPVNPIIPVIPPPQPPTPQPPTGPIIARPYSFIKGYGGGPAYGTTNAQVYQDYYNKGLAPQPATKSVYGSNYGTAYLG